MTEEPRSTQNGQSQRVNEPLRLYQSFRRSPYRSIKHDSYFQTYERLLGRFVGQAFTFVEVGVLNGGSLFMWREYFGPQARIIGVDLNPGAKRWEADGFEIHIGSQSDPQFWAAFFAKVGPVHVLLDDGGHTNEQQIITVEAALPHILPGGLLAVEDVHASYMTEFGNPSAHSFINFSKLVIDAINSRSSWLTTTHPRLSRCVYAVEFFESIVAFNVDPERCFDSAWIDNGGKNLDARDMRHDDGHDFIAEWDARLSFMNRVILLKSIKKRVFRLARFFATRSREQALGRHFR